MRLLYNFFIRLFWVLVWLASLFNAKAKQWIKGRKGIFKKLKSQIGENDKIIWFHCASLGEFEQGRPVFEEVRSTFSGYKILLTFYSPSGYEVRKNFDGVDFVYYLPLDTRENARKFIQIARPRVAFFIKYEFWFNFIDELYRNKIPLFVVSAIFRHKQYFFQPWARWSRKQLQKVTYFFVQNEKSLALLRMVKVYHADISGDTRFDRVVKLASEKIQIPVIDQFSNNTPLIIAGSTWPADEEALKHLLVHAETEIKLVIAPHLVNKEHIDQLLKNFEAYHPVLYSNTEHADFSKSKVLIIDSIGMLAYIYRYGQIAFIGGGFGAGLHNILEASTYGIPVIFGPNYDRFREAVELAALGGAFPVNDKDECTKVFNILLKDDQKYKESSLIARSYVNENAGATQTVIDKVKEYLIAD